MGLYSLMISRTTRGSVKGLAQVEVVEVVVDKISRNSLSMLFAYRAVRILLDIQTAFWQLIYPCTCTPNCEGGIDVVYKWHLHQ